MARPSFAALQILTAANLTELVTWLPTHVYKAADGTAFPSTTTLANDEDLSLPVAASRTYVWQAPVCYVAGTTADLKLAWTFPAGATLTYTADGLDTTGVLAETLSVGEASGFGHSYGGIGIGSPRYITFHGRLAVASTAGSLTLQRAQVTSTAENTTIKAGSHLTMWRVD